MKKLEKTHLLRYDEIIEKLIQDVLDCYDPPMPTKASIIRVGLEIGLKQLKEKNKKK